MGRKLLKAVACTVVLAATVAANSGPAALPKDRRVAEPPVRFEGIDQYPDYVFYLTYHIVYGGSTLDEVTKGRRTRMYQVPGSPTADRICIW